MADKKKTSKGENKVSNDVGQRRTIKRRKKGAQRQLTPQRIQAAEKARKAMALRQAGATWDQIAKQVGFSRPDAAARAVNNAMKSITQEGATELGMAQYERLNFMLLMLWPSVQLGDLSAIARAQSLMQDMNDLKGVGQKEQDDADIQGGSVFILTGVPEEYTNILREARGEAPLALTQPVKVQTTLEIDAEFADMNAVQSHQKFDEIDDAEVIEEDDDDVDGRHFLGEEINDPDIKDAPKYQDGYTGSQSVPMPFG